MQPLRPIWPEQPRKRRSNGATNGMLLFITVRYLLSGAWGAGGGVSNLGDAVATGCERDDGPLSAPTAAIPPPMIKRLAANNALGTPTRTDTSESLPQLWHRKLPA